MSGAGKEPAALARPCTHDPLHRSASLSLWQSGSLLGAGRQGAVFWRFSGLETTDRSRAPIDPSPRPLFSHSLADLSRRLEDLRLLRRKLVLMHGRRLLSFMGGTLQLAT